MWYSVCVCLQLEVLQESRMMIPDCQRRLSIAHGELQQLLVRRVPELSPPRAAHQHGGGGGGGEGEKRGGGGAGRGVSR